VYNSLYPQQIDVMEFGLNRPTAMLLQKSRVSVSNFYRLSLSLSVAQFSSSNYHGYFISSEKEIVSVRLSVCLSAGFLEIVQYFS